MRKVLGVFTLLILSFLPLSVTHADDTSDKKTIIKQLILKKRELEKKSSQGKLYIQALDAYFEKYKDDREKIETLLSKVTNAKGQLGNSPQEQEISMLMDYIEYKSQLALLAFPKFAIVVESKTDVLNLSEEELEVYISSLDLEELEGLAISFYKNKSTLYNEVIAMYELQIEKARDTTRIVDLKTLQAGIEQSYQDYSQYPSSHNFVDRISLYIPKIPSDSLAGYTIDNCNFGYQYEVGPDTYGIENGAYKLSTCFENPQNTLEKAINTEDGGDDHSKYEIGYWNQEIPFNEELYLSGVSEWERYYKPKDEDLDELDAESRKEILSFAIYVKYLESHPEIMSDF